MKSNQGDNRSMRSSRGLEVPMTIREFEIADRYDKNKEILGNWRRRRPSAHRNFLGQGESQLTEKSLSRGVSMNFLSKPSKSARTFDLDFEDRSEFEKRTQ